MNRRFNGPRRLARTLFAIAAMVAAPAHAHVAQGGVTGGLVAGFVHPILGLDHVVAMVAVGIWGAQLGRPAIYVLPITFPLVMAFGGVLGVMGVPIPGIETGIAATLMAQSCRPRRTPYPMHSVSSWRRGFSTRSASSSARSVHGEPGRSRCVQPALRLPSSASTT